MSEMQMIDRYVNKQFKPTTIQYIANQFGVWAIIENINIILLFDLFAVASYSLVNRTHP